MIKAFIFGFLISISTIAFAGNGTSGGGGAFVCRDNSGNVKSSYLLDLWEAQQLLNLNIILSDDSVEDQIGKALNKLKLADPLLASKTADYITIIFSNARRLGDDIALPAPLDADSRYQKKGCPLEGMMFFNGDLNQLEISSSVYDKLATNTDFAAAKIHEALYFVIRNNVIENTVGYGGHTSTPIRQLVGCLFSTNNECLFPALTKNQILERSESVYLCNNSELSYYLVKNNTEIESSRPPKSWCETIFSGGADESWLGLLNQVEEHTFSLPTFFTKQKNLSFIEGCSNLIKFGFSTNLTVQTSSKKDPHDGHPLYTGFEEYGGTHKYGTPLCAKIK